MKVKNVKHFAILGAPFTVDTMGGKHTYKKGYKANVRGLYENGGEYVVEGHGTGHVIPLANFTKFLRTWNEVTVTKENENGAEVVKTIARETDTTTETLAWFAKRDAEKAKAENKFRRGVIRNNVAELRKAIDDVKTGKAEKELAKLIAELETLN